MKAVHLQIPAAADYIDLVRLCLTGVANKLNYSYEEIEDMKVAVSEACNNAVLHGGNASGRHVIDISFEPVEAGLMTKVINYGPPFAYQETGSGARLQGEEPEGLRAGGLGIYLMEALMDEVHVCSDEDATEVKLIKYRV
ncbi:ATP-binding protein [Paenibacillus sp. J5C_2022]|uniref:ATP-binding protein n=1 Tax=Paenibacillus sp. J5C2022 TaxID=2977129 RepID=UPI0021D2CAC0|nr:ATP-binding protein [Paenibacillus sp. J5C2022]MCU6710814.1 ATP-binding protein [Paenibacillus sp. J5C2022]